MDTTPDIVSLDQYIEDSKSRNIHINSEWLIDYNHPLGKGAQSIGVFKGTKLDGIINGKKIQNNGHCAIKIVSEDQIGAYEIITLDKIIKLNSGYNENIIEIYGYAFGVVENKDILNGIDTTSNNVLYIYMEYLYGYETILQLLKSGFRFKEDQIAKITKDLVYSLAFLHENHIIHRDIKSSNILINVVDGQINIKDNSKVIDFGVSKFYGESESKYNTIIGTQLYMAPEVIMKNDKNKPSSVSDIWSVGCTVLEMAGGTLSNKEKDSAAPVIPDTVPIILKNFIQSCLVIDPYSRFKAIDLINHEFLNNIDLSNFNKDIKNKTIAESNDQLLISNIDLTTLGYDLNSIASNIKTITLLEFDEDLTVLKPLPKTLTTLKLPSYNQPITSKSIPKTIKSLEMLAFNQDIDDPESIPDNVTELILGDDFEFNDHGGNIPDTIKRFTCGFNFTKSLSKNNNIPKRVSTLVLNNYNHPITKGSIPSTVHTLTLGSNYQHFSSLSNLPTSVFNLTFGVSNECTLTNDQIKLIPNNITKIIINNKQINK